MIAGQFGFKEEEFFEIPEAERAVVGQAPRVDFGVGSGTVATGPAGPPPSGGERRRAVEAVHSIPSSDVTPTAP